MNEFFSLLKRGNKSAFIAACVNGVISVLKLVAYLISGNVAMFAETMHSLGDTANQLFVFVGSALSKKAPTKRFPGGFGRLVNLVLLAAVLVMGIMAFEAIKEGWHHIFHPTSSQGLILNLSVLFFATVLESSVLYKAMKEVCHETAETEEDKTNAKGLKAIKTSLANFSNAKPATKLVFMEDSVATAGGVIAMIAVLLSHFTSFHQAEGIASVIIGVLMFVVVGFVFMENAAGAIGESDIEMSMKIEKILNTEKEVKDIKKISVVKEGDNYHVEIEIEVDKKKTVEQIDDVKDRLEKKIMNLRGVTDVIIEYDEDDGIKQWKSIQSLETEKDLIEK